MFAYFLDTPARFIAACDRIQRVMGVSKELSATEFSKLAPTEQERVLTMVEATAVCAEAMVATQQDAFDSGKLSWRVLNYMGLRPDMEAYSLYHPGDVIEVYDSSHKLIFASLNFLKLSAYSLDALYSRPWTELWERGANALGALYQTMVELAADGVRRTVSLGIAPDVATEIMTGRKALVRTRGFSSVAQPRAGNAVLCVNEIVQIIQN